jgi:phosphocarrier protein
MVQQKVVVRNSIGIHSRPATLIVDMAEKYKSSITIAHNERTATAHSMVRLLALKVKQDNEILVSAEGEDESDALAAVVGLVEAKFGEN